MLRIIFPLVLLPITLLAQENSEEGVHHQHDGDVEEVVVTANPLNRNSLEMTQAVSVLAGEALESAKGGNIGETLSEQVGIHNAGFGAAAGRPVIRGLGGKRVRSLESGVGSMDLGDLSPDHAVTIEPLLADRIEVIRGPATLLYGGGAIGGVVNVIDGRIPEHRMNDFSAALELRGSSVDSGKAGTVRMDMPVGDFAVHVDGFRRNHHDYQLPEGAVELHTGEELEEVLHNSSSETRGGAAGFSWQKNDLLAGFAISEYQSLYGVPGHAHGEDHGEEHDEEHKDEHGEEHEEEAVRIDMKAKRIQSLLRYESKSLLQQLEWRFASVDYQHREIEDDKVSTFFESEDFDSRLVMNLAPVMGWSSVAGWQMTSKDLQVTGEEAFIPDNKTTQNGLFMLLEKPIANLRLEAGFRFDRQKTEAVGMPTHESDHSSISFGWSHKLADGWRWRGQFSRAGRMPGVQELFANGPHVAMQIYEIGNSGLANETSSNMDLGLDWHGKKTEFHLDLFKNRIDHYISLAATGDEEEGFPVYEWQARDADFQGMELTLDYELSAKDHPLGAMTLGFDADRIEATYRDSGNVPRIPPMRAGVRVNWEKDRWFANMALKRYFTQDHTADFEEPTPAFTMLNASASYIMPLAAYEMEWFFKGKNLLDADARNHSSVVKDFVPMPGRGFELGLRMFF